MAKYLVTFLAILILSSSLYGLTIPFSKTEIKTESNCLYQFVRISPDDSLSVPLPTDVIKKTAISLLKIWMFLELEVIMTAVRRFSIPDILCSQDMLSK